MFEGLILVIGLGFILYTFIRNTYYHGMSTAKVEAGIHFDGVKILMQSFVDVFVKGKTEKEILDQ